MHKSISGESTKQVPAAVPPVASATGSAPNSNEKRGSVERQITQTCFSYIWIEQDFGYPALVPNQN